MPAPLPKAKQAKIAKLADKGLPNTEIASKVGCTRQTVANVLKRYCADPDTVEQFEKNKPVIFQAIQNKGSQVVAEVLNSWSREEISALTPSQKNDLLRSTALATCQFYDKYRLETGQSTANNASLLLVARADAAKVPLDK